jgi:glycolate oxidase iron-sulfur subunit
VIRELTADCVHCGFCLPTCPTYVLWSEEMDSPRGRIHLMDARLSGAVPLNATVATHFDRCLGCMACVTSCPSGVQYDRLLEATRIAVEDEYRRPRGERVLRALLFTTLPYPRRLRWALRLAPLGRVVPLPHRLRPLVENAPRWQASVSLPKRVPARAARRGSVGLLTGCVQSIAFGDVNAASARVLAACGFDVVVPEQGCCGALSAHAGRAEEAKRLTNRVGAAFGSATPIVVNAAGCGSHLKDRGLPAQDLSEALTGAELPELHPLDLTVAYQDSCHLRHAQRLPAAWLPLLQRIPGLRVAEPAEQDLCCGAAGIYNLLQVEAARELGDRKARNVLATGADACASANPGCLVQVADALHRAGKPLPALHPVELLDASLRGVAAPSLLQAARR